MSAREFAEWMAYYRLEPFGEERADLRAGIIASASVNVWAKRGRSAKPSDFMPKFAARPQVQSLDEIKAKLGMIAELQGVDNGPN